MTEQQERCPTCGSLYRVAGTRYFVPAEEDEAAIYAKKFLEQFVLHLSLIMARKEKLESENKRLREALEDIATNTIIADENKDEQIKRIYRWASKALNGSKNE